MPWWRLEPASNPIRTITGTTVVDRRCSRSRRRTTGADHNSCHAYSPPNRSNRHDSWLADADEHDERARFGLNSLANDHST